MCRNYTLIVYNQQCRVDTSKSGRKSNTTDCYPNNVVIRLTGSIVRVLIKLQNRITQYQFVSDFAWLQKYLA